MRVPHAASTLIQQVRDKYRRTKTSKAGISTGTPVGEPDGFGRFRSVKFDKTSSKWLAEVLPHLDDPRIVGHEDTDDGLVVHFTHRTSGDSRAPFPLEDAALVAAEEQGESVEHDSD